MDHQNEIPEVKTNKKYFAGIQKKMTTAANNAYAEFRKHPTYYISSAAMRLSVGAGVSYGMYYGLTALAAPYLAPVIASTEAAAVTNQLLAPMMQGLFANIPNLNIGNITAALPTNLPTAASSSISSFINYVPKVISAVSALGGLLASTKLSNILLSSFFGEVKLKANISKEDANKAYIENVSFSGGILKLFGQNRPYITPVSEITTQLEQEIEKSFKDTPDLLPHSKMLAFAYTKKLVETNDSVLHTFDANALNDVNGEAYVSAAKKVGP